MVIFEATKANMRKRFETQLCIGLTPISEIKLPTKSRDELAPTLAALQFIFINQELNERVFTIVEKKIKTGTQNFKGREGMNLWEILVLAVCRLTLDCNYDRIQDLANHHSLIRALMYVDNNPNGSDYKEYGLQTIKENLMLLDQETIMEINELVVEQAHHLVLKKNEKLRMKSDTFVLETNVHFPTDYNLLWDATRKCLDIMDICSQVYGFEGWRKLNCWKSTLKNHCRTVGKACSGHSKNKDKQVKATVEKSVNMARNLAKKIEESIFSNIDIIEKTPDLQELIEAQLLYFLKMLNKHIDLLERRLIKEETIPSSEKIYSIFEPHTEWISKGKINKGVELGHNILICSDQYGFIVSHKVVEKQHDSSLVIELADKLLAKYGNQIQSISFDKGFYSQENKALLELEIPQVIMPKKGKLNAQEKEQETAKAYKKLRHKHSAVESNINELEHHGLNRCPDKGMKRFKTYVSLGVLSYNLLKLGKVLWEKQASTSQQRQAA